MTERHVQCSTSGVLRPEGESRNVPTLAGEQYVDGYYCSAHADAALDAARAHVAAEFFHRHAITIHEHRRGDPPEAVRPLLELTLDHLVRGTLKLQIGETVPLNDVLSAPPSAPAPPPAPEPAVSPPPAAAEPRPAPSLWQRIRRAFGRAGD